MRIPQGNPCSRILCSVALVLLSWAALAAPPAFPPDFDGDGKSDLVWSNADGSVSQWLMNGTSPTGQVSFGPYAGWSLFSADGDFNGDGKSDMVWTNTSGAVAVWLMNGASPISQTVYGPYAGWTLLSANSDFDGDGTSDLLWINPDGQVAVWLMTASGTLGSSATFGPYPGWKVVSGHNDFDGDGKSDLLWANANGAAAVWLMNGATVKSTASFGPYAGWTVTSGSADYDGDGKTDLLWTNASGAISLWLMNGTVSSSVASFGPYAGWSVVPGRRDLDGDGKSDLLWTNLNGAASAWLMNGTSASSITAFGPYAGWSVLDARGDYNGDHRSDLLWANANGASSVWLMNGATPTSQVSFGPYAGWNASSALSSGIVVSTLAGPPMLPVDGTGTAARFNYPAAVTGDASGNVYVADSVNNLIRKITPAGVVSTLAGSGFPGAADGTGTAASFNGPAGLAIDPAGNIYVADTYNHEIRKVSPAGVVTTLAGSTSAGSADGTGTAARFFQPSGIAIDGSGNLYVADSGNNEIRKITAGGVVTTLAGSTVAGSADGSGAAAGFSLPLAVALDGAGNVYVADTGNSEIRAITPAGVVTTLAGTTLPGSADGTGAAAGFNYPAGIVLDGSGVIYVADAGNNEIRKIQPGAVVSTWLGSGASSSVDGTGTAASFYLPLGVAWVGQTLYIADAWNSEIRQSTPQGVVTTFAGAIAYGSADGTGPSARFSGPFGTAVDAAGNLFVADRINNLIRKISPAGVVTTLAGSGSAGAADGSGAAASFNDPMNIAVDTAGNLYVADRLNHEIRKITAAGVVTTLAGSTTPGSADGTGAAAGFRRPRGVAVDGSGNVYVADTSNNEIRRITPAGAVTTLAGSTTPGAADGTGAAASFWGPFALALDPSGNLLVTDSNNNEIRKVTMAGVVTTVAGTTTAGSSDGIGAAASFSLPQGIAVDAKDTVYVADFANNLIRRISPAGVVTTIAGQTYLGAGNGAGPLAGFYSPHGVAVDATGNLYVSDPGNSAIRKLTPASP